MKFGNEVNLVFSVSNQMDPLTTSGVCGEGGAVAVSPLTPLSTQRGAPDACGTTVLGWTPWTGGAGKRGTAGAAPTRPR